MHAGSKGLLGKVGIHHAFLLQILKSRGATQQCQAAKGLFSVCGYRKHIHIQAGKSFLERAYCWFAFHGRHIPWAPPWYPVIEKVSMGGYLKGDIEGLEMTLQVIQLNEVGCVHRLAIHKGGWRHDSERGKHEICHPNAGSPLS